MKFLHKTAESAIDSFLRILSNKKGLTKYRCLYTHTSSGLAHYLLCGDLLSTNTLMMKADSNHSFTDRTLNFNDPFRIWICIKQSFIFATWTGYMHIVSHDSPLQSHSIIIWRMVAALFNNFGQ